MAIEYRWAFPSFDVIKSNKDELVNVVSTVHWTLKATDGDEYSAQCYGSVGVPTDPQPDEFVEYESLTEELVQQWVVASMGETAVAELEASLAGQIEIQKHPVSASLAPPWA